ARARAQWRTSGPGAVTVGAVAADPAIPGLVYASAGHAGLFVSSDGGGHWSGSALGSNVITALGTSYGQIAYAASSTSGVFQSPDRGLSWTMLASPGSSDQSATRLLASPCDRSNTVFYSFVGDPIVTPGPVSGGLRRSLDGGRSWLGVSPVARTPVAFAIDARDQCRLYAWARESGTYQSADRGTTWTPVQTTIKFAQLLVADPTAARTFYAVVLDAGGASRFLKSVDGA